MVSNISSTTPSINPDSTISAIVRDSQPLAGRGVLLRLWLPIAYSAGGAFGRFFLARCTEDTPESRATNWSIYARRALYCAGMPTAMPDQAGSTWEFFIPNDADPGHRWLASCAIGSSINLLGPFGQLIELAAHTRSLLILADLSTLPKTLPLIHTMLDRGGRVTLLVKGTQDDASPLLPLLPFAVEVRVVAADAWLAQLAEPVRWADQLCAALPNHEYVSLAHHIRTLRFQLDPTFAYGLVNADMLCGVGACLACVVTTRDGNYTRTCIHGPVFPLADIAP